MKVDGTYIGGQAEGTRGRGAEKKTLVLVGVEGFPNKKLGRVRISFQSAIVDTQG